MHKVHRKISRRTYQSEINLLKAKTRNTRTRCEIYSKLTIDVTDVVQVFSVNFELISQLVLVFLLLTLNM